MDIIRPGDPRRPPVHYQALPASSTGADDAVEGDLFRGKDGYLFKDAQGNNWWVMFADRHQQGGGGTASFSRTASSRRGRIVAYSNVDDDEAEEVRVLALDVSKEKAEEAFQRFPPGSLEEAARLAASLEERD